MKKIAAVSIFIFLTGMFAGLFFSTELSESNNRYLSALLISAITDTSAGFFRLFLSSIISNLSVAALMLASVLTRLISPLPFALLLYKSFTIGFCSGLIYLNDAGSAFLISLVKILPPNLFIIPAFTVLTAASFLYSRQEFIKSKRPSHEKKDLQTAVIISLIAIVCGCLTEAICHSLSI